MANAITISVIGDTRSLVAGVGRADSSLTKLGRNAGKVGRGLGLALAAGGAAALVGAKQVIDAASDVNEELSKSQVIFGRQAEAIRKFSENAATSLGQSQAAALDATSTFGQIAQKAGLSGKATGDFAMQFTTLASDLASFNNTTPEQAIEAIGAAMRGEAEPIRKYGVMLDDATLKAEALKQGLISSTKDALTPQQKALAASAAILAQTTKAQGDFARTSDGAANKQRIIAAQVENLKAKIGQGLLPVYALLLGAVSRFINYVSANAGLVRDFIGDLRDRLAPAFDTVRNALEPVVKFLKDNPTVLKAFAIALGVIAVAIGAVTLATAAFSVALNSTGIPLLIIGLAALAAGLVYAYQQSDTFRGIVDQVGAIVRDFAGFLRAEVIPRVTELATKIGTSLKPILAQLAQTFTTSVLPVLKQIVAKFREWQPTIQRVIVVVVKIIGKVLEFAAAVLGKVLPPLIRFYGFMIRNVVPAVLAVIGVIVKVVAKAIAFGAAFLDTLGDLGRWVRGVKDKALDVLNTVLNIPGKVVTGLGDLTEKLLQKGKDLVGGFLDGAKEKGEELVRYIASLPGRVAGPLGSIGGKLNPLSLLGRTVAGRGARASSPLAATLLASLKNGEAGLDKFLKNANERIAKAYRKRTGEKITPAQLAAYTKAIRGEVAQLRNAAAAYAKAKAARAAYAADVRNNALSFADVTGVGQIGENGEQTAASIVQGLNDRLNAIRNFRAKIAALSKLNLRKDLLEQIIAQGVEGGTATAEALVAGGAGAVRAANAAQAQIAEAAKNLGTTATDAVLAPLDRTKVIAAANTAAATIASVLRKRLKLRVDILTDAAGPTKRTVVDPRLTPRTPVTATASTTGRRSAPLEVIRVDLSAEQLSAVERGRRVTIDLKAYQKAGGR